MLAEVQVQRELDYFHRMIYGSSNYAKNSLDEWIYFFKNSEVRAEFEAKGLKKAAQEWDVMKLDKEARKEYEGFVKDWRIATSEAMSSFVEGQVVGEKMGLKKGRKEGEKLGIEKGRKEGEQNAMRKVARSLLTSGDSAAKVAALTGLSEEEMFGISL